MKKIITVGILLSTIVLAFAQGPISYPGVSIIISGENSNIKISPKEFNNLSRYANTPWAAENIKDYQIVALKSTPLDGDWEKISFSFMPEESGKIRLILNGKWQKDEKTGKIKDLWVAYDNFKVTGAKILNPDFEEFKPNGTHVSWITPSGVISKQKDEAQSGKYFIATTNQAWAWQYFDVKKGQKVTIEMYAKPLDGKPEKY